MLDYHRTMAVGATRIYVLAPEPFRVGSYLEALREGRSFVTTGPLLDFRLGGERPGGAVPRGSGEARWTLTLASAGAVEQVDLLVNGAVVESLPGLAAPGSGSSRGPSLSRPAAGSPSGRMAASRNGRG